MIRALLSACIILYLLVFPSPVFAAVTVSPMSVNTSSPVIGDAFSVTASISGALVGNVYFLKCRIGANSYSLNDGQTFNSQTTKWLEDTGLTGAWVDMPQMIIGGDGTWQGVVQCKIKSGSVDESKTLFMRACLNLNNACGTSFQSSNTLVLSPQFPTPTPTSSPTNTPTPTNTSTPVSTSTSTPSPTITPVSATVIATSTIIPTRAASITPTTRQEVVNTDMIEVPAILGVESDDAAIEGVIESSGSGRTNDKFVYTKSLIIALLFISTGIGFFSIASLITKIDI